MYFVFYFAIFMFGAALFSAVDCLLWKCKHGENWVTARSVCEGCAKTLRWWEIIPVFSGLFLRGRCPRCGYRFGMVRSCVEAMSGLVLTLYLYFCWDATWGVHIFVFLFYLISLFEIARLV